MEIKKPRTKKSPLLIEETFPPPYEKVKLKIIAHPDDLSNLAGDYYENPEELGKVFLNHFIDHALYEIITRFGIGTPPRGIHKKMWNFNMKMKIRAPYTFGLIDYWLKQPQKNWPRSIKKVVSEFEDEKASYSPLSGKKKRTKAHEVLAYIMERNFGKEREILNPKSKPLTDDPGAFKKTYILKSSFMNWVKMKLKDLEEAGIELPPTMPIISEKPDEVILALFPNSHNTSTS